MKRRLHRVKSRIGAFARIPKACSHHLAGITQAMIVYPCATSLAFAVGHQLLRRLSTKESGASRRIAERFSRLRSRVGLHS